MAFIGLLLETFLCNCVVLIGFSDKFCEQSILDDVFRPFYNTTATIHYTSDCLSEQFITQQSCIIVRLISLSHYALQIFAVYHPTINDLERMFEVRNTKRRLLDSVFVIWEEDWNHKSFTEFVAINTSTHTHIITQVYAYANRGTTRHSHTHKNSESWRRVVSRQVNSLCANNRAIKVNGSHERLNDYLINLSLLSLSFPSRYCAGQREKSIRICHWPPCRPMCTRTPWPFFRPALF